MNNTMLNDITQNDTMKEDSKKNNFGERPKNSQLGIPPTLCKLKMLP